MKFLDFDFTEKLDLNITDDQFTTQSHAETTLITSIFTNARVRNTNGYWLPIRSSKVWTLQQSRLTQNTASQMVEYVRTVTQKLVKDGIFSKILVSSDIKSGQLGLVLRCFDYNNSLVVDRKFFI